MADNQDPNITLAQLLQNSESARQAQKDLQQQIEASQTAQRDYNLLMEEANEQMRIAADLFRRGAISFEQYN